MSRQPYVRTMPKSTWYMRNGRYRHYILKERTCLLVGVYCFLTIWALAALAGNTPESWEAFLQAQRNDAMVVFHGFALIYFFIYQTMDWFKLAPKAMPVHVGENKLPNGVIVAAHYLGWALATLLVFWLAGVI